MTTILTDRNGRLLVRCLCLTLLLAPSVRNISAGGGKDASSPAASKSIPVSVSADGQLLLTTNPFNQGLQLVEIPSGKSTEVTGGTNAGYHASISPDGEYVGFKSISGGSQAAMLYAIGSGSVTCLASGPLAGTPAFSRSGKIAYTIGNSLVVRDRSLNVIFSRDLGLHVNLVAISAKGNRVAYNDGNDQIVVLNLNTGKAKIVTDGADGYWRPVFSPNGNKLLVSSLAGDVFVGYTDKGTLAWTGQGSNPGWVNNQTIAANRIKTSGNQVLATEVIQFNLGGLKSGRAASVAGDAAAVTVDGTVAIADEGGVTCADLKSGTSSASHVDCSQTISSAGPKDVVNGSTTVQLSNVPYIHQNNDTPDWWNGNSSCNATAALMAIQYHNILPKHPMTASWPSPHNSDYGWYVPNNYTWNGHTYNIASSDPNGTTGYGGFGYITQNGWEDTKGHMAEFISYHGPTSAVDWSPTMAKARTEVDANHPFVILVSITSSGHYPTCIGYVKNQNTLIFNDPYGNKNTGSYPSPDGRNARYDWPGYNNGYQNLVTVHCYIWCRMGQPSAPTGLTATAVGSSQINLAWTDASFTEANYEVLRSTTSGGPYSVVATLGANVTSYSNTGLAAATTYYYVVRARNASGAGANSNQASATTGGSAPPPDIIIDNNSAGFTASANWSTGTSAADKYGTDYRYRSTAAVSDQAVWNFTIAQARNYEIYAWWSQGANRSATASFTLPDNTAISKNQQTGGGVWNSLGIKNLSTGAKTVKLSCWTTTGFVVVADAVKVVAR